MANATTQLKLSASAQGRRIKVAATATPGTLIHTTGVGPSTVQYDRLYINAENHSGTDDTLNLEVGGTTAPDDVVQIPIPSGVGLIICLDGDLLSGDGASGANVRAFATGAANRITVGGFVARVTP